ncbi:MAG: hypothetical protein M3Y79_09285 [Pseudomonadota bacterium]|nr:hypothetical protein [Pseudomonadota bacterium]
MVSKTATAAAPAVPHPIIPPARADLATLQTLVHEARRAAMHLAVALRELERGAGNGAWRGDFVIAMEKAEAAGFWFREGTRTLQADRQHVLLADDMHITQLCRSHGMPEPL